MPVLQGQGVSRGIAGGTLRFLRNQPQPRREVADREGEIARFEQARQQAIAQLAQLHEDTIARLGEDKALLFEIHQMMLDDLDYRDAVTGMIQGEGVCAEYAVEQTGQQFSRMFAQMDDSYMRERAADPSRVVVHDTICRQVSNRNPHLQQFARRFDAIVFVCGRKSSNGKVLYQTCLQSNPRSYTVEDESELRPEWFEGCRSVGICGATSTPKWLMQRVADRIGQAAGGADGNDF